MLNRSRMQGVSLIEVMVAIVVLSIGLLGIASLQLRSLRVAEGNFQKTIANIQAQDLVDSYWAGLCQLGNPTVRARITAGWQDTHENTLPGWTGNAVAELNTDTPVGGGAPLNYFNINIIWADRGAGQFETTGITTTGRSSFNYRFLSPLADCTF